MTCVVAQGKVAGVLFRLNYSIHQYPLALDVIQAICLDAFNLAKVNTILYTCTAVLRQRADDRLHNIFRKDSQEERELS